MARRTFGTKGETLKELLPKWIKELVKQQSLCNFAGMLTFVSQR